jgi:hypothetical protein
VPKRAAAAPPRACPNDGKPRVCLGATGSVAAVKVPELVALLLEAGAYVDLVLTRSAAFFQGVTCRGPPSRSGPQQLLLGSQEYSRLYTNSRCKRIFLAPGNVLGGRYRGEAPGAHLARLEDTVGADTQATRTPPVCFVWIIANERYRAVRVTLNGHG